jgi:N6-adenosine-specific RNA methylase IME4
MAPRGRHSEKPEEVYNRIERLVDGPYLELFARRERPGWTCLGHGIDGQDMATTLLNVLQTRVA